MVRLSHVIYRLVKYIQTVKLVVQDNKKMRSNNSVLGLKYISNLVFFFYRKNSSSSCFKVIYTKVYLFAHQFDSQLAGTVKTLALE